MPRSMASRGERMAIGSPSRRIVPASRPIDAENGASELGASGADKAGQPEDLAARAAQG